jgi:invasion protein IalB
MRPVQRERSMGVRASAAAAAVLGAALITAGAAPAQDVAAWRVECTGDGKTLDCRAVQQLFQRDTRQLVLAVLARKAPDPKAALIQIQMPLGLNLTEPIQIKVDNGAVERHPIQTCTNTGCFAALTANERLVTQMRNGTDLKVTFQDANKKPIEMAVPLLGFAVAFDKVRT